jgi:hypothetical protein
MWRGERGTMPLMVEPLDYETPSPPDDLRIWRRLVAILRYTL